MRKKCRFKSFKKKSIMKIYHVLNEKSILIIKNLISTILIVDYNFRRWHYAEIKINHFFDTSLTKICVDINFDMLLINRQYLKKT